MRYLDDIGASALRVRDVPFGRPRAPPCRRRSIMCITLEAISCRTGHSLLEQAV